MKENQEKKRGWLHGLRPLLIVAALVVVGVTGFLHFYDRYNEKLLYEERLNQMREVTTELFAALDNVAKNEWISAETQCQFLTDWAPQTLEELLSFLERQARLSDLADIQTSLIAVDSDGLYYTETGRKGLLSEQRYLLDEPEQVSYVSNSMFGNNAEMVFLNRLPEPLTMTNGSKTVTITYFGIAQNMEELGPYFTCSAYAGVNGMYVVDEHGLKIFGDSPYNKIRGYNVYTVLSQMDYLHGSSFGEARQQLEEQGYSYSNAVLDGEEYYYALYRMESASWTLLFTVPSGYVATNTVELVSTATRTVMTFAILLVVICALLIFRMLSQQQKLELELERRNSQKLEKINGELQTAVQTAERAEQAAKSANRAKTEFLSNMSHDIRTPMNAIVGITKLMEHDRQDEEKLNEYIHKVQTSSQHLLSLINDVLDMSKIESGGVTLNREKVSLADQVRQVDSIVQPQVQERKQRFEIRIRELTHEFFIGDAVRLRQVIINLLSNAIKYTPNGGQILFELSELESPREGYATIRIRVQDTGYGMTPEFVTKIFEPFTRAENSTTNKIQGTGLGMAITKNIVELMGGTITVESTLGKGSTFEVTLPLQIDRETGAELDCRSILAISDEKDFIKNIRAAFRGSDIRVFIAETEAEADRILEASPVDVVLLGSCLEGGTLADNLHRLREKTGEALLIYCCEYDGQDQLSGIGEKGGVDAMVERPLFLSALAHAIDQARGDLPDSQGDNGSGLKGLRFLCAEDNTLNAEILNALMDMNGASCVIYPNGQALVDAFATVKPGDFDAILMDIQMPILNGLDATRAIRASANPLGKTIPIIAMTANAFSEDVQNCLDAGMNAHVAKPLDIGVMIRTIRSVLGDKFSGGGDTCTPGEDNIRDEFCR